MSRVLKAQLFELEKQAATLERIVYNMLTSLMTVKDGDVERYEDKILRKLVKLDDLQDEIDATVAKLKEAGAWEPVRHTGNVYEYNPPGSSPQKPKPRQAYPRKPRPKSVKPPKIITERGSHSTRLVRSKNWIACSQLMRETGGEFTVGQLMEVTGQSQIAATDRLKTWANAGLITKTGLGREAVYASTENGYH
ncbi:helix-turn-helix domain-containing protein [Arthrobacter sp. B2a2-09]|uniref:hypothetical protein n=1 Tax=Arthrobacter sp. B2a2-09 TaxID=2952822 RepID=UPI0022CD979E|nr:hypothetical protein [Arthrobacter sp. B2a2-09]MCZ9883712.1 hypothetical protein [Arthrobacter sp. B2a2-09]